MLTINIVIYHICHTAIVHVVASQLIVIVQPSIAVEQQGRCRWHLQLGRGLQVERECLLVGFHGDYGHVLGRHRESFVVPPFSRSEAGAVQGEFAREVFAAAGIGVCLDPDGQFLARFGFGHDNRIHKVIVIHLAIAVGLDYVLGLCLCALRHEE